MLVLKERIIGNYVKLQSWKKLNVCDVLYFNTVSWFKTPTGEQYIFGDGTDPCFGKIVQGHDTIEKMHYLPTTSDRMDPLSKF